MLKNLTATALAAVLAVSAIPATAGWFDPPAASSDKSTAKDLETMLREAERQVPLPSITNWTEKRMVANLYELRDDPNYRTYTYIVTMTGDFVKICDSIGYGINASIQLANPEKVIDTGDVNGNGYGYLPQAEPNGLFMPEGLAATYVMCLNPLKEEIVPVYAEQDILVSPFPYNRDGTPDFSALNAPAE